MEYLVERFGLHGKGAVVTGGSKGLGRAIARAYSGAGARVFLFSRNGDEAEETASAIDRMTGNRVFAGQGDVSCERDVRRVLGEAREQLGQIDVLVNNAGINLRNPIEELSLEEFRQVQRVNVEGAWLCCREVVADMKGRRSGRIINVASALGRFGLDNRTPYTASKGALLQLTRTLALELADFGVTCNAICPGPFRTPMNEEVFQQKEVKDFIRNRIPLKRWAEPQEIEGLALYLASPASSFMTGAAVFLDGGWSAA